MPRKNNQRPDVAEALRGLKDFQRRTVDYVFQRLYLGDEHACTDRFLIADEVGLGKTLVARGVIARAVDHLWKDIDRIDVVYICSNQDIARQNIDRLNIDPDQGFQLATRATLMPIEIKQLKGNKLNFVSLTPGTSFNLRSQTGVKRERAVLYLLIREAWDVQDGTLGNLMRGDAKKKNWRSELEGYKKELKLDSELQSSFVEALRNDRDLYAEYQRLAALIGSRRTRLSWEMRAARNAFIGKLRRMLAHSSLTALEPDLVILDEFQRFKELLDKDNPMALLAQELFHFEDVKILLLSATPYKMYTLQSDEQDDHYQDFLRTVEFLLDDRIDELDQLKAAIDRYRHALFRVGYGVVDDLALIKAQIERILRQVMVRTERLAVTPDRNGMLEDMTRVEDAILSSDLASYIHLDRIARAVNAGDQIEHWKSSAYPLNLMDDYKLKRAMREAVASGTVNNLSHLLEKAAPYLLSWEAIQEYQRIDPGNARLRSLFRETVDTENWRLLWVPASLPYYEPDGNFAKVGKDGFTKSLVFSSWRVVPKTIAVLASYEAERRMIQAADHRYPYSELTKKRSRLLEFNVQQDRLRGMPVFCLIYPCLTLATRMDPLEIAIELNRDGLPTRVEVINRAKAQVHELLKEATRSIAHDDSGPVDETWYWAALALLDRHFHRAELKRWFGTKEDRLAWGRMLDKNVDDEQEDSRYVEHVERFVRFFRWPSKLGRQPDDLEDVLTWIALAGPAVATLRATLRKVTAEKPADWIAILASSAKSGLGFRTLFNSPDAIAFILSLYGDEPYWMKVLRYCLEGNLQAVMDEYFHILYESLGLMGHGSGESALKLNETLQTALSLRSPSLRFDDYLQPESETPLTPAKRGIRCRYALRFGDEKSDETEKYVNRKEDVRVAFNSPFRPYILATTSIGQEGLDFHQYCHQVVHWNLPPNPVDLEQREGRVHRYKGHVIRRNLAKKYGLGAVAGQQNGLVDPWEQLFNRAIADCRKEDDGDASGLKPFWIFEVDYGYAIERRVPMLPLSREIGRIQKLKRSLVAYRSVIGQPRQQELTEFLARRLTEEELINFIKAHAIDLSPPQLSGS